MTFELVEAITMEHQRIIETVDDVSRRYRRWPLGQHGTTKGVRTLIALASRHEAAEARILWPVVRDRLPETSAARARAADQERDTRRRLHALQKVSGTDASVELVQPAVEAILRHVRLEEQEILPALAARLDPYDAVRLGRLFEELSAQGPTRPHPHTPAIPGVLALVTPLARRADRIRDILRVR
ncbi:MAG TPA: hemerythrin domain-containing protein [Acidimicrobiales bacterium]|nr:hemerythrin domain-containing protein [Acidimicrobiales bacterium]